MVPDTLSWLFLSRLYIVPKIHFRYYFLNKITYCNCDCRRHVVQLIHGLKKYLFALILEDFSFMNFTYRTLFITLSCENMWLESNFKVKSAEWKTESSNWGWRCFLPSLAKLNFRKGWYEFTNKSGWNHPMQSKPLWNLLSHTKQYHTCVCTFDDWWIGDESKSR